MSFKETTFLSLFLGRACFKGDVKNRRVVFRRLSVDENVIFRRKLIWRKVFRRTVLDVFFFFFHSDRFAILKTNFIYFWNNFENDILGKCSWLVGWMMLLDSTLYFSEVIWIKSLYHMILGHNYSLTVSKLVIIISIIISDDETLSSIQGLV